MKNNRIIILFLMLFSITTLLAKPDTLSLNGSWKLWYWDQPYEAIRTPEGMKSVNLKSIPATVPGTVEIDLEAAGLIPDPLIGNNVKLLRAWENKQWCYEKTFTAPKVEDGQRLELFFGGIDCLADIWLNDKCIGSADNMMIEHIFDVTNDINQGGSNTLKIIIRSAFLEGQNQILGSFTIGNSPANESVSTRKPPHMYGWDILPRMVSAGLWRDVELRTEDATRITNVHYITATLDTATHQATMFIDAHMRMPFERFDNTKAIFTISRNGKVAYKGEQLIRSPQIRQVLQIDNVDIWWPRGMGEPALYDATMELVDEHNTVLASNKQRIGFRTVKLERDDINLPEKPGTFRFIINGEPVFIHGTNWVPMDIRHSRDKGLIKEVFQHAVNMNCNMIRCWGGNVYEDHDFFDLCDENGIMVWQDFTMGCTFYPQRDYFTKAIEKEVTSVVLKLRNHPSIVLWAGNNEDDDALRWTSKPLNIDPSPDVVSRITIPRVIYEFDPTRPYLPSSPYYSKAVYDNGCKKETLPEDHLWGNRGWYKAPFYTQAGCAFVSEIGYPGCSNTESLKKMMTKDKVYPWDKTGQWNDEWVTKDVEQIHKHNDKYKRLNYFRHELTDLFGGVPTELEDFVFATQASQGEALKYFVEIWRSQKFEPKTGILWWNLREGWPGNNEAVMDYYNSPKMSYYFIKNAQTDVCVMINDPANGSYPVVAVNDTRVPVQGKVTITNIADGKIIYKGDFSIAANGKANVTSIPERNDQGLFLIEYDVNGKKYKNHYLYGTAPFKLNDYRNWIDKAKIIPTVKR